MPQTHEEKFDTWLSIVNKAEEAYTILPQYPAIKPPYYTESLAQPTYLIPGPLVRAITYFPHRYTTYSDDIHVPNAKAVIGKIEATLTDVGRDLIKADPQMPFQGTSTWTGTSSHQSKNQELTRQFNKFARIKPFMEKFIKDKREVVDEFRMIFRQYQVEKYHAITLLSDTDAMNNILRYAIDKKNSSFYPGLKYKQTTRPELSKMVTALKGYAERMLTLYEDEDKTLDHIGYYKEKQRVRGFRHRSGILLNYIRRANTVAAEELVYRTRDIAGIPGGSQEGAILGEEYHRLSAVLCDRLNKATSFKILTPYLDSTKMWQAIKDAESFQAYDGSNWQSVVGILLSDLTSNIYEGWLLLSSGHGDTSLAGLTATACTFEASELPLESMAMYGDDGSVLNTEKLPEKILESESVPILAESLQDTERQVHLGVSIKLNRVNSFKMVHDSSTSSFRLKKNKVSGRYQPLTLHGTNRYHDVQKAAIAVQYGLIPFKKPIDYLTKVKHIDLYDKDTYFMKAMIQQKDFREILDYYKISLKGRWR